MNVGTPVVIYPNDEDIFDVSVDSRDQQVATKHGQWI